MPGKQEVTRFIRATFRSVWSLELLCVLRDQPERAWRPAELVAALRASDLVVSQGLAALTAAGLVVTDGDGLTRYQPATPQLDTMVAAAVEHYVRSPDSVRRLIVSSATGDLATFAEAFRLRRE